MPVMFILTIQAMPQKGNFYKARFKTNAGKKTTSALAVDVGVIYQLK